MLCALKCVLKYAHWSHCIFLPFMHVLRPVAYYQMSQNETVKVRYEQQIMLYSHGCCGAAFCRDAWTGFGGLGWCGKLKPTRALICKKYFKSRQETRKSCPELNWLLKMYLFTFWGGGEGLKKGFSVLNLNLYQTFIWNIKIILKISVRNKIF